ncbi:Hypothetical protein POVN_LOCUS328 [uncultured virus]|nr:Hypothetical protein POVN_LOCUS328 [uncultured virus]
MTDTKLQKLTPFDDTLLLLGFKIEADKNETKLGAVAYVLYQQEDREYAPTEQDVSVSKDLVWRRQVFTKAEDLRATLGMVFCGGYYNNLRLYQRSKDGKWVDASTTYLEKQAIRYLNPDERLYDDEELAEMRET